MSLVLNLHKIQQLIREFFRERFFVNSENQFFPCPHSIRNNLVIRTLVRVRDNFQEHKIVVQISVTDI